MPPGPCRATTCRDRSGEESSFGSHIYILDHTKTWRPLSDEGSAQCRGHLRYNTNMKDDTHHPQPFHSNKANMKGWLWRSNDIRGPCEPKASWHLSYRLGKNPKNLTQDTCLDRGSNPGPLRDKRACCHLPHNGGRSGTRVAGWPPLL